LKYVNRAVKLVCSFITSFIRKNYVLLLSFFAPAVILTIAYITCSIFPFGKRSILIIDLYHQYAPFISDLQDKLKSFSSLLYSWNGGLGTNYLVLYGYYLASPLNLLIVLFPKEHLAEAILVLTLLKIGLSGVCFALYLKYVHHEESFITVAISLLYALSGYMLTFSWNIMWIDSIVLLPLIMLGLVRFVRESRGLFYCTVLAIALLSNFYMAFFICIFTLLYYPVCLFCYQDSIKPTLILKKTAQFAGYSLLSAGMSAVLLLPTYFYLKLSSAADDIFPKEISQYYDLFDFIARHFTGSNPSIREGMPNLYSGIIVLVLIPVYFMSKSVKLKHKLWNISILLFLIVSFNTNILNFIWHGFHYPNQIPYRYSFVYIFLVLSMSYEAIKGLHEFTGKQIGAVCISVLGLIVLSQKFEDVSLEYYTVYISIIMVIIYAAALTYDRSDKGRFSSRVIFLTLVITAEVITNTIVTVQQIDSIEGFSNREGYSSGKEVKEIRDQITQISADDNSFYRMEILPPKTANDPCLYNYRGLSLFSSTSPLKPVKMFKNLGYSSNGINSYEYEGSTAILDSLFGIKYLIYRSMNIEENLYEQVVKNDEITVYKNPYAIPLGFQSFKEMKDFRSLASNPFESQNRLVAAICGIKDVFIPVEQKHGTHYNLTISGTGSKYFNYKRTDKETGSTARLQFTIEKDQQIYMYFKSPYGMKGSGFVMLNDKKVDFNPKHSSIINLGFCKAGTSGEMQIEFEKEAPESGSFEIYTYSLNQPVFKDAMEIISKKSMNVESYNSTGIHGSVDSEADGIMVMTIPYDKGWSVEVDNHKVETIAIDDCLLGFALTKGSHKIDLKFVPDKSLIGLMISAVSILVFALLAIKAHALRLSR